MMYPSEIIYGKDPQNEGMGCNKVRFTYEGRQDAPYAIIDGFPVGMWGRLKQIETIMPFSD